MTNYLVTIATEAESLDEARERVEGWQLDDGVVLGILGAPEQWAPTPPEQRTPPPPPPELPPVDE